MRLIIVVASLTLVISLFCFACEASNGTSASKAHSGQAELQNSAKLPYPETGQLPTTAQPEVTVPEQAPKPAPATVEQTTLAAAQAKPVAPSADAQKRRETLLARTFNPAEGIPFLSFRLDKRSPKLDIARIPAGKAIDVAAKLYVISTLDFLVTPRKIIDNGFWPYSCIDSEDLDKYYCETSVYSINSDDITAEALQQVNTADWLVLARTEILNVFNSELDTELAAEVTSMDEIDFTECNSFWINPYINKHMLQGHSVGEYYLFNYAHYKNARKLGLLGFGTKGASKSPSRIDSCCWTKE